MADAALVGQGEQQLALILSLKRLLGTASPAQIADIGTQIATAVASATATARLAEQAASNAGAGSSLASARQSAQQAVNEFEDAYFKQRKFDPYLQFKSEEDERAYREREERRRLEIEAARAEGTAHGDKRAIDLSVDQMRDAGTHGADRSSDYKPTLDRLLSARDALGQQLEAAGQNKDAAIAPSQDPLDVAPTATSVPQDLAAKFRAAGVTMPEQNGDGHGLTVDASQRANRSPAIS